MIDRIFRRVARRWAFLGLLFLALAGCNRNSVDAPNFTIDSQAATQQWRQLGSSLGQGANPKIALNQSNQPVVASTEYVTTSTRNLYVKHWTGSVWSQLGGVVDSIYSSTNFSMAIGNFNNPAVAYVKSDKNLYVKRWTGSAWLQLGPTLDVTLAKDSLLGQQSVAVDASGNPVVTWMEQVATPSYNRDIYVKRWNGTSWVQLGATLDLAVSNDAISPSIAINSSGNPVIVWAENQGSGYNTFVKQWNGSSWTQIGSALNTSVVSSPGNTSIAISNSGAIAAGWSDRFGQSYDVYVGRWTGSVWSQFSRAGTYQNFNLAFDSSGNPLMVANGNADIGVIKWTGSAWSQLGSDLNLSGTNPASNPASTSYPYMASDSLGNPFVTWTENGNVYVKTFTQKGAKIILLQNYGFATRTSNLGSTQRTVLNSMPADGFTVTTAYTESLMVPDTTLSPPRPMSISQATFYNELDDMATGVNKDVFIEAVVKKPGDLFDDAAWNTVTTNFSNLAKAGVQANNTGNYNFRGIFIDNEDYLGTLFRCRYYYPLAANQECSAAQLTATRDKMYARGKAIMDAILTAWPTAIVMTFNGPYMSDCGRGDIAQFAIPDECDQLDGLFFAGMVDSVNVRPGAHPIVSGGEDYYLKYPTKSGADARYNDGFQNHYNYVETMGSRASTVSSLSWIPSALRGAWAYRIDVSFGVYNHEVGPQFGTNNFDRNIYTDLTKPKTYLQNAKCAADEFVWFYIENSYDANGNIPLTPIWYTAMPTAWKDNVFTPAMNYVCP
jgi:hypothetical protein